MIFFSGARSHAFWWQMNLLKKINDDTRKLWMAWKSSLMKLVMDVLTDIYYSRVESEWIEPYTEAKLEGFLRTNKVSFRWRPDKFAQ